MRSYVTCRSVQMSLAHVLPAIISTERSHTHLTFSVKCAEYEIGRKIQKRTQYIFRTLFIKMKKFVGKYTKWNYGTLLWPRNMKKLRP